MNVSRNLIIAIGALLLVGVAVVVAPRLMRQEGANWSSYGGDATENHYSPLHDINDGNVSRVCGWRGPTICR